MKQRTLAIDMYAKSEANTLVNNIKNEMIKVQELGTFISTNTTITIINTNNYHRHHQL